MIYGRGSENPDILIVSDYPSAEEIAAKSAFVGSNESFYQRLFSSNQYSLSNTYRTTFCKEAAPIFLQSQIRKGKIKWSKPTPEIREWADAQFEAFQDEIKTFQPKVIIGAGDLPLWYIASEEKIRKFRGSIIPSTFKVGERSIPYIPILPSRYIFSDIKWKTVTQLDISKAIGLLSKDWKPFPEGYHLWTCFSDSSLRSYLERIKNSEFVVVDIETFYNFITCIGLSASPCEACCIPIDDPRVPRAETISMLRTLARFNSDPSIKKIGQNFNSYDWTVLEKRGFEVNGYVGDTLLLSHVLYPELPRALDFLTSIYTDIPYYKDDGKEAFRIRATKTEQLDKLYYYNCTDCVATYQVYQEQLKEAAEIEVDSFYKEVEFPCVFLYHELEKNGIQVDSVQLDFLYTRYILLLDYYTKRIEELYGAPLNIASPKQVSTLIYDFLECPPRFNRSVDEETGEIKKSLATDEETLQLLSLYAENEAVRECLQTIIAIRKIQKIIQYLEAPIYPDGRMRTSAKLAGTKTGRTSFAQTLDFTLLQDKKGKIKKANFGLNFQNIPKHEDILYDGTSIGSDLRSIYVPKKDHVFIEGDKSQAEARVVAILADNLPILHFFDHPPGVHRITAGWIYGVDPEQIKKDSIEYQLGKRGRHMANYDGGSERLSMMASIPLKQANFVLDRIHETDPSIRGVFHDRINQLLENREYIETPHGRKRQNMDRVTDKIKRDFYAYIPQATVSDDVKLGMRRLWEPRKEWIHFLNESHDSCLAEIHRDRRNEYIDLFRKEMQQPIDFRKGSFYRDIQLIIPIELSWSEANWAIMKKIH
jgi:DNA polymerase I-like protein with 3'-5' exonuclease and polymerase domains/uracil-DNA glycosylase